MLYMNKSMSIATACAAFMLSFSLAAQDSDGFTLFEPLDSGQSGRPSSLNSRRSRDIQREYPTDAPVFLLVGLAKIGGDISINLRHMSGEDVRIKLADLPVRIPGFEGFSVLGASGRTVSIRHPDSAPCLSFSNEGVECDAELNTSLLQLAKGSRSIPLSTIDGDNVEPSTTESTPVNPFDVIRRSAESGGSATETDSSRRFRPRRIDPADVPPGMRVVSTPFGDRLVED